VKTQEIIFLFLGFLSGGLMATVIVQGIFQRMCFKDRGLPWRARAKATRFFGFHKWSEGCEKVDKAERAVYATVMLGALHDLGGPLLLAPRSTEAFDGFLAEYCMLIRLTHPRNMVGFDLG
jgi:hypothetical protein